LAARTKLRPAAALGGIAAVVALLLSAATGGSSSQPPHSELPRAPAPALRVGEPQPLHDANASVWADVRHLVAAREAPIGSAASVTELSRRTPEGTANAVLVLGRRRTAGRVWVRVRLPVLPNGTTGWVPRGALGAYHVVHSHLVVDLRRQRLTLRRGGRPVLSVPVGVGRPGSPTPSGQFYVRNRLARFRSAFYGPLAFGTSARSAQLTDWPGGGFIGIHGTNRPDLIPGRISHGCIRLRNSDIVRLGRLMPVGTPITIE
jgi:hypothetical protein